MFIKLEKQMFKKLSVISLMAMLLCLPKSYAFKAAANRGVKDTQVVYYPTNVENIEFLHEEMKGFVSAMLFSKCSGQLKDVDALTVRAVNVDTHSLDPELLSTIVSVGIEVKWKAELKKDHDLINMSIVQEDDFASDYQDISLVSLGSSTGINCR